MSHLTVQNFALENHCEPCALKSGVTHSGVSFGQENARIVSSKPAQSMYENHIDRMIQDMNASQLGKLQSARAKANMTGYNAGFATFTH
jgi:hypothetical protein